MLKFTILIEEGGPAEDRAINVNLHTDKERASWLEERFADRLEPALKQLLKNGMGSE